jgi:hypothetical protein
MSFVHFGDKSASKEVRTFRRNFSTGIRAGPKGVTLTVQKLLCSQCDAKFGKWESYARDLLYRRGQGPDIQKRELGESIKAQLGIRNTNVKYFRDLRQVLIDYKTFKLFELSLLWRAGLETKSWGRKVKLGSDRGRDSRTPIE